MKTLATATLFAILATSTAHAEIKIEPRLFHSNLRMDSSSSTDTERVWSSSGTGRTTETTSPVREEFRNTHGVGLSAVFGVDPAVDLGIGYSYATYYDSPKILTNHKIWSGFSRFNFLHSASGKVYTLVGLSSHQFDQVIGQIYETAMNSGSNGSFSPLLNYDVGIGATIAGEGVDWGLEYKYSNTITKGKVTSHSEVSYKGPVGSSTGVFRESKIKGFIAEEQEVAVTLGIKI